VGNHILPTMYSNGADGRMEPFDFFFALAAIDPGDVNWHNCFPVG